MADQATTKRGGKRTRTAANLGSQDANTSSKKSRTRSGQAQPDAEQSGNSGFQMMIEKFGEVIKRLELLETRTATTKGNDSTGPTPQTYERAVSILDQGSTPSGSDTNEKRVNNVYIMRPSVEKPMFNGRGDINPTRFLKKLRRYINSLNAQDRAIDIATECLSGPALKLLELNSKSWLTLEDFETDFRRNYWANQHQEAAKYRLMNATYDKHKNLSMSEHFADQIDSVNSLTIPLSESDLVNCVMRHFPTDVQQLWFTRAGDATILTASEFLRNLEHNVVLRKQNDALRHSHSGDASQNHRGHFNNRRGSNYTRGNARPVTTASIEGRTSYSGHGSTRGRGQNRGRSMTRGSYRRNNFPAIQWRTASNPEPNRARFDMNEGGNRNESGTSTPKTNSGNGEQSNK